MSARADGLRPHQRAGIEQMMQALREQDNEPARWEQVTALLAARQRLTGLSNARRLLEALAQVQVVEPVGTFLRRVHGDIDHPANRALVSLSGTPSLTLGALIERGWNLEAYQSLGRLARHAVAHRLALSEDHGNARWVGQRLVDAADSAAVTSDCKATAIVGWLTVAASMRDIEAAHVLLDAIAEPGGTPGEGRGPYSLAEWSAGLGADAGLAWAAGLRLDEARQMHGTVQWDVSRLRGLAALRGITLSA